MEPFTSPSSRRRKGQRNKPTTAKLRSHTTPQRHCSSDRTSFCPSTVAFSCLTLFACLSPLWTPVSSVSHRPSNTSTIVPPALQPILSTPFPGTTTEPLPGSASNNSEELGAYISKILNNFFTSGYDKRVRPSYGGIPVQIGVTMFVISISSVSEVQMDFTSDFYFRQHWKDSRLSFTPMGKINQIFVGAEVSERIWLPDTFFANEKSAYFHIATTKNTFLRITNNGDVTRSIRLTVTASCPMDLQYFPMDRQMCAIEIESYGYSMSDIEYKWLPVSNAVSLSNQLSLPQFRVLGHRQKEKVIELTTGNYSRLICEIQFARSLGFYLIQIYIPASLIVVISWVSFWLHRNATPARVSLGVTTVLTMTTLMSSTNAQLPKISYIKSIDVFLGTCFVMVFGSLLEYAIVGYLGKRISMRKSVSEPIVPQLQPPPIASAHVHHPPSMAKVMPSTEKMMTQDKQSMASSFHGHSQHFTSPAHTSQFTSRSLNFPSNARFPSSISPVPAHTSIPSTFPQHTLNSHHHQQPLFSLATHHQTIANISANQLYPPNHHLSTLSSFPPDLAQTYPFLSHDPLRQSSPYSRPPSPPPFEHSYHDHSWFPPDSVFSHPQHQSSRHMRTYDFGLPSSHSMYGRSAYDRDYYLFQSDKHNYSLQSPLPHRSTHSLDMDRPMRVTTNGMRARVGSQLSAYDPCIEESRYSRFAPPSKLRRHASTERDCSRDSRAPAGLTDATTQTIRNVHPKRSNSTHHHSKATEIDSNTERQTQEETSISGQADKRNESNDPSTNEGNTTRTTANEVSSNPGTSMNVSNRALQPTATITTSVSSSGMVTNHVTSTSVGAHARRVAGRMPNRSIRSFSERRPTARGWRVTSRFLGVIRLRTCRNPNKVCGLSPSDIDKYSRVIFPVSFFCFNLMYWIIYLHISDDTKSDLVPLGG